MKKQLHFLSLGTTLLLSAMSYGQTLDCTITASANPICLGDTATLSVNSNPLEAVYWSDGTSGFDSIQLFPTQTTTYDVIIFDGVISCSQSVTIVVNNPQINAGQDQQVCTGSQFTLTAIGADTYSWNNGVTNGQPFTFTTEGYYTVVGTDAFGCSNTVSVYLDLISPTSSTISPTACNTYTAPDGAVYTSSGTYTAVIPNAVGCDSTITINLTVHLSNTGTDTRTVCDSLVWIDGIMYYADNNSAIFTGQNVYGCDSVVTLNLTVNKLTSLDAGADVTVCKGEIPYSTGSTADEPMAEDPACPRGQQRRSGQRQQIRAATQQAGEQQGGPWFRLVIGLHPRQPPGPSQALQERLRLAITPQPPVQRPPAADSQAGQQGR
jgi:hypothetical protein